MMTSRQRAPLARFLFSTPSRGEYNPSSFAGSTPHPVSAGCEQRNPPLVSNTPPATSIGRAQPNPPIVSNSPLSNENILEEELNDMDVEDETGLAPTPNSGTATMDGSPPSAGQKMFVGVAGQGVRDFDPRPQAFSKMCEIVRSHFTGSWPSISKIPPEIKILWFEEFEKLFYWTVSRDEMWKVFIHQAGLHIKNTFKSCRDRKMRPYFLTKKQWEGIEHMRKTDPKMLKQAAVNKQNRSSPRAIDAGNYRGGSRKVTSWMKVLEKKCGKKTTISDVVRRCWQKKDGTWSGPKPAAIVNYGLKHAVDLSMAEYLLWENKVQPSYALEHLTPPLVNLNSHKRIKRIKSSPSKRRFKSFERHYLTLWNNKNSSNNNS